MTGVGHHVSGGGGGLKSPLLPPRPEIHKVAHVVIAADRGLCGGYNSSVIRAAAGSMREQAARGRDYGLVVVGRKAESYFRFRRFRIDAAFTGSTDQPAYADAQRIADSVSGPFLAGEYDLVELIYTRFVSAGRQEIVVRPLMPLDRETIAAAPGAEQAVGASYEFEPSPEDILERLLPRYAEARVYAALLNAAASEHAARQRAMKAATDNAEDLIIRLTRAMNRARQAAITTEIMEILGGAAPLRPDEAAEPPAPDRRLVPAAHRPRSTPRQPPP